MAGRMSNRDRISKLAAEKAAERREKEVKKKTPSPTKAKSKAKARSSTSAAVARSSGGRMCVVWAICDQSGNQVKTFPYPARKDADAEAERLSESKGKPHFVKSEKVPME
jgi:hypothetical protein